MFKDTVTNKNMCTFDLNEHVACCLTCIQNAPDPQVLLQPFFHIDVKIMENKLLSCLRTQ